jgi:tetratricopeptide (TPR) repeat protein
METIENVDGVFRITGARPPSAPDLTVYAVGRAGYAHAACYQELVEAVYFGLRQLGCRVALATAADGLGGETIVIGGHLLGPAEIAALPPKTVIYNTEHVRSAWFTPAYTALLRRFPVWDYSEDNARRLAEVIGREVQFVPLGYVPQFSRAPTAEQDIDVLFYGSSAPRRDALFAAMRRSGLVVHQVFGVYGAARDALIARAKVVANVHHFLPGAFEIMRVSSALANAKAVATECNPDELVDADLRDAMLCAPYVRFAEACHALVADAARRGQLGEAGRAAFARRNEAAILRNALAQMRDRVAAAAVESPRPGTIGLCMIVKNEAHVIVRCLDSVRRLVDHVLIEDTGSTDGTQQIVRDWLVRENLPGAVIDEPWQDFAANRTSALAKLRDRREIEYALIMDADDVLVYDDGFDSAAFKAALRADIYTVPIRLGSIVYQRPQICRNALEFRYRGVVHEFLEGPPPGGQSAADAAGFHITSGREGARSRDPQKYQRDAAVLQAALASEQDPFLRSRYTFYLAQSYRDCGEKQRAIEHYLARVELGYWAEEVFVSLLNAARLMEEVGRPFADVRATYDRAAASCPTRAEALHGAAQLCFRNGRNREGYELAKRGLAVAKPASGLFLEPWIYDYGLLDQFAINGYWAGEYAPSLDACLKLLGGGKLPQSEIPRVVQNARFAFEKMPQSPNLGALGRPGFVDQFALAPERRLRSRRADPPRVLVAILAKQMEVPLPLYLRCIESLDYPKRRIVLYVRTNNNTDRTEPMLREWLARVGDRYAEVQLDAADVPEPVERFGIHEWNATRFKVLARIRDASLRKTIEHGCDYYFVADIDNFLRPCTLRELVALGLPVAAPFLRSAEQSSYYSNYHAEIDGNGYYLECDQYHWALNRWVRGIIEMPVVHCTYLVRADVAPELAYEPTAGRHEYVVFSESARRAGVPQYLDNRQVYGYLGRQDDHVALARSLLEMELQAPHEDELADTALPALT